MITEKRLKDFYTKHPHARSPMLAWIRLMRAVQFASFDHLRRVFSSADYVDGLVIFDIGGNNYRIVADVVYAKGRVYIKQVFTHSAYDEWNKRRRKRGKR